MLRITRFVGIVVGLILLAFSTFALAQYSAEDEQNAIDAVTSFLIDMGETKSADMWKDGWKRGIYTFKRLPSRIQAEAKPGSDRIAFNQTMVAQLDPRQPDVPVDDWAATFHHEVVHTKQGASGWVGAYWSHTAGFGDSHEAAGWGRGFESYWGWLRLANARYAKARTEDERQKYAQQIVVLSQSFQDYFKNYLAEDLGPLPKWLEFAPLRGSDSTRLTMDEALSEAARINKTLGDTLRLAVRLNRSTYNLKAGTTFSLTAHPKNSWNKPSFTWKAGSTLLAEKGATLTRTATVDETITVTIQDNRNQKASASCVVNVQPATATNTPPPTTPSTAETKPPATQPAQAEYAWVRIDERTNDWKERLDRRNEAMKGSWKHSVSAAAGSVTITNTYIGNRTDAWMKNGMSNTGTATWTPPSKTMIRSGDVVSLSLTTVNAPRDHSNFGAVIYIKVEAFRLDKNGKRTGSSSYFANENGKDVLGAGSPRGNQTKAPEAMTVSRKFGAGAAEGEKMAICVTAGGESEMVQTEYVYEWKKL